MISAGFRRFRLLPAIAAVAVVCSGLPAAAADPAGLPALSVRGVNYYPRATPWGGMWTATPEDVWERDMALAASLHANTVRAFLPLSADMERAGLLAADGSPTVAYQEKIASFLTIASRHGIRVLLCFDPSQPWLADPARWANSVRGIAGARRGDRRVLLWDAMNEPEDDAKWTDATRAFLRGALPLLRQADPGRPTTVGLTWRIDRLLETGLPDVLQYHEYCPKRILFENGWQQVAKSCANQRKVGGDRPLLIGEFGLSTARDPEHGCAPELVGKLGDPPGTEDDQARLFRIVLEAAEKERLAGVMPWCLHDYPIGNPNEAHFGLVRADGTLKPAAIVLKETYARWEKAGAANPKTGDQKSR